MRWQQGRRSTNVEDRRGQKVKKAGAIGGGTALLMGGLGLLLGGDPFYLIMMVLQAFAQGQPVQTRAPTAEENVAADFVTSVLAYTEDTWAEIFAEEGLQYEPATLVLFTDVVNSACGFNTAATGPFYCPLDGNVYIDVGFFDELQRLGGEGDFAGAYVIAHEVGHHVQNLLGTSSRVQQAQRAARSRADANALSVLLELQADCYAGVWASHANEREQRASGVPLLDDGDLEEGLETAAAIGDDRLMRQAGRAARPESFTHGSSEQRAYWLATGFRTGEIGACDTFAAASGG
ncbi:MAG: neutral zinc metallopeptidase [marine benthic group bacterium]|jgi:predicted metalloprotease|nr:neutral zinc metallopeptidase [Gemmatimonadota bacterium]MCL7966753.1 neutral zinc metallopeptidase [Gemmatimonadota bacterium]MCL7974103.1 neutral zinc metallopeptidase [Gemmatimonadota bacterium]MCL7977815.1 neutral zinc metallopeptidase [Gemmatimonadota bacterium]MCL7983508.1 neutral zinc metallopeptidase [Gemmatimonadota bacterium]